MARLMISVEFGGAAGGEVTGSSYIVGNSKGTKIMVDCGKHQDDSPSEIERNSAFRKRDFSDISAVLLTHAHNDHFGNLPYLSKYNCSIFATRPTIDLGSLVLEDSDSLNPGYFPQGSRDEILKKIKPVNYDEDIHIDSFTANFRNAARHVLGSSSIEITEHHGDKIVFGGDLGNKSSRMLAPAKPIKGANGVILEATRGADIYNPNDDAKEVFKEAALRTIRTGGKCLIPVSAIGKVQEVIALLKELSKEKTLNGITVYLDSKMARKANFTYNKYKNLLNENLQMQESPLHFSRLVTIGDNWKEVYRHSGPAFILAGAGMMNGGKIVMYGEDFLPDEKSTILFTGHCAKNTVGRRILEGEKRVLFERSRVPVTVRAKVLQTRGISSHSSNNQTVNEWLYPITQGDRKLRTVFITHGTEEARKGLQDSIESKKLGIQNILLPKLNETIPL